MTDTNTLIRERDVERHLTERVKALGGWALKWSSPGTAGVPDRLVFLPGGRLLLVELKAPGKKPRTLQKVVFNRLAALGFPVLVADTKKSVDGILGEAMR